MSSLLEFAGAASAVWLAMSHGKFAYFTVLLLSVGYCYSSHVGAFRKFLSVAVVAVTWFYIIRFMSTYEGEDAFDGAYADVIWGEPYSNWSNTQMLLCWALVATVWSAESSIFYTLFGLFGAMSGSYLLLPFDDHPKFKVPIQYAILAVIGFASIIMLPSAKTTPDLGWWLWVLHACILASKLTEWVTTKYQIDRCFTYCMLAVMSFAVHVKAPSSPWPKTDCQISITLDMICCAGITIAFIYNRSKSLFVSCISAFLLPIVSPGCVLASFCALELDMWPRLVSLVQLRVAIHELAKTIDECKDGKTNHAYWMNLGYWKGVEHYEIACKQLARMVGNAANLEKGDRLLCLACGGGDELLFFKKEYGVAHTVGLDAYQTSPMQSILNAEKIRLVHGKAEDIVRGKKHFCHNEFNKIVVVDSVYHFDKEDFFKDCALLLPKDGMLAVSDVILSPSAPWWIKLLLRPMGIRASNQWTQEEYKNRLEAAGLRMSQCQSLEPCVLGYWFPAWMRRHLDYVVVTARVETQRQRPKAAVVGSGLSGLVAARLLSETHEVKVFEARSQPGFAGWEAKLPNGAVVDIPLRILEQNYWKQFIQFCTELGVPMVSTNFTVSMNNDNDQSMINTSGASVFWNVFTNFSWYLGVIRAALRLGLNQARIDESLGAFAKRLGEADSDFYRIMVRCHLSWILSCTYEMVDNYPLHLVQNFFQNIVGNFFKHESPTMRIWPSVQRLEETLLLGRSVCSNCPVPPMGASRAINGEDFSVIVIATEANAVSKVLPREWTKIFDDFQYYPSHVIVHRDASLMPKQQDKWRALNLCDDLEGKACEITIWVNAYYSGVDLGGNVFETVNPRHRPHDDLIIRECHLQRVVHDSSSKERQQKISMLQGRDGFYFCGAYSVEGLGLLEQAYCSAKLAVEAVHRDMKPSHGA
mmetsp:Transcript_61991/g.113436  ORF Transcript_61991/g.113436 Transcript_61991/m.113436 type:complete len:926 (+) Transcript_61991:36-2813(+)